MATLDARLTALEAVQGDKPTALVFELGGAVYDANPFAGEAHALTPGELAALEARCAVQRIEYTTDWRRHDT